METFEPHGLPVQQYPVFLLPLHVCGLAQRNIHVLLWTQFPRTTLGRPHCSSRRESRRSSRRASPGSGAATGASTAAESEATGLSPSPLDDCGLPSEEVEDPEEGG